MYSSNISSDQIELPAGRAVIWCGDTIGCTFEVYPVEYWYTFNADCFGRASFTEWDLFWFVSNLETWSF